MTRTEDSPLRDGAQTAAAMTPADTTTTCGLASWRPGWLQRFARKEYYALVYSLIGITQGMAFSYLSTVLSTIEKQFGIKSKETAWVFSGNEIR